ncbi:uncharacterized protein DS421_4g111090 [Arachis hypogaea]|nr:uncharacterized protein DS421_4g111090 [Arachis hypogaea]
MLTSGEDSGCRGQVCQSSASLPASCVDGVAGSWNKAMRCQCLVGPEHRKQEEDLEEKNEKHKIPILLR